MRESIIERNVTLSTRQLSMLLNQLARGCIPIDFECDETILCQQTSDHRTVLHCAAAGGLVSIIREAIDEHRDILVFEDASPWRSRKSHLQWPGAPHAFVHPLHVAAGSKRAEALDVVKYFIEELGMDPFQKSYQNLTPLHCALAGGNKHIIYWLIEQYTPEQLHSHSGGVPAAPVATLIAYAAYINNIDAVKAMVARGASISRYSPVTEELFVNAPRWITPLVAAIAGNRSDAPGVIPALCALGADVNQIGSGIRKMQDSPKTYPLFVATKLKCPAMIAELLYHGANPNAANGGYGYNSVAWIALQGVGEFPVMPDNAVSLILAYGGRWDKRHKEVLLWKFRRPNSRAVKFALEQEENIVKYNTVDRLCHHLGIPEVAERRLLCDPRELAQLRTEYTSSFLFDRAVWAPKRHYHFHPSMQSMVKTLLRCFAALRVRQTQLTALPPELQYMIIGFVDRAWPLQTLPS